MKLKQPVSIIAAYGFARKVSGTPMVVDTFGGEFDVDDAFENVFENRVRRASRFVKFSNLAAHTTMRQVNPQVLKAGRLGLFLGTGLGNLPDIIGFSTEIVAHPDGLVSPAHFVNTVSNAGLFYAARDLEIECMSSVISQERLSFEAALFSAGLQMESNECDVALVGGVDVFEPPMSAAVKRCDLPEITAETIGEGSGFVVLAKDPGAHKVLGQLTELEWGKSLLDDLRYDSRKVSGDFHTSAAFGFASSLIKR